MICQVSIQVLRSAKPAAANVRRLNNISDVIFYCSVGERLRALALLNAALVNAEILAFFRNLQNFRVFSVYRHFQFIHSLNKLPFERLPACLIFLSNIKYIK